MRSLVWCVPISSGYGTLVVVKNRIYFKLSTHHKRQYLFQLSDPEPGPAESGVLYKVRFRTRNRSFQFHNNAPLFSSLNLFFCYCLYDHGTDGLVFTVYPVCLFYLKDILQDGFRIRIADFGYFKDFHFPGLCYPIPIVISTARLSHKVSQKKRTGNVCLHLSYPNKKQFLLVAFLYCRKNIRTGYVRISFVLY